MFEEATCDSGSTSDQVRQKVLTKASRGDMTRFSGFRSAQAEREDGSNAIEIEKDIAIRVHGCQWLSRSEVLVHLQSDTRQHEGNTRRDRWF